MRVPSGVYVAEGKMHLGGGDPLNNQIYRSGEEQEMETGKLRLPHGWSLQLPRGAV